MWQHKMIARLGKKSKGLWRGCDCVGHFYAFNSLLGGESFRVIRASSGVAPDPWS